MSQGVGIVDKDVDGDVTDSIVDKMMIVLMKIFQMAAPAITRV